jgi:hypothetical protein
VPDFDELFRDRLRRMPWLVWLFAVGGLLLGFGGALAILSSSGELRSAGRVLVGGLTCLGFVVGVTVGCVLDMVFRSRRERKEEDRRPGKRRTREPRGGPE